MPTPSAWLDHAEAAEQRAAAGPIVTAGPIRAAQTEIARLRQVLLDIATEAGDDTSMIDNPDQLVHPSVDDLAMEAVKDLRRRYEQCLEEHA